MSDKSIVVVCTDSIRCLAPEVTLSMLLSGLSSSDVESSISLKSSRSWRKLGRRNGASSQQSFMRRWRRGVEYSGCFSRFPARRYDTRSFVFSPGYGELPSVKTSHSRTPNDQTSVAWVKTFSVSASRAIHL